MKTQLQKLLDYFMFTELTSRKIIVGVKVNENPELPDDILIVEQIAGPFTGETITLRELTIDRTVDNLKATRTLVQLVELERHLIELLSKNTTLFNIIGTIPEPIEHLEIMVDIQDDIATVETHLSEIFRTVFQTLFNTESKHTLLETSHISTDETEFTTHDSQIRSIIIGGRQIDLEPEVVRVDFSCSENKFCVTSKGWDIYNEKWIDIFSFTLILRCFIKVNKVSGIKPKNDIWLVDMDLLGSLNSDVSGHSTLDSKVYKPALVITENKEEELPEE